MRAESWRLSWRADPIARRIADRHYNRQKVGAAQFVPPGRCLVLLADDQQSLWVTSWPFAEYVQHDWAGAWMNSSFRREGGGVEASDLIREAVAATLWKWPDVPPLGMVTFIDPTKVKGTKRRGEVIYGYSYLKVRIQARRQDKGRPARVPDGPRGHARAGRAVGRSALRRHSLAMG